MIHDFRFRAIGPETAVYGVVGVGTLDSPIVAAHNAAFTGAGLDAVCIPLPTDDNDDAEAFARALGISLQPPVPPASYQLPTTS
jgi:hypothetical protein